MVVKCQMSYDSLLNCNIWQSDCMNKMFPYIKLLFNGSLTDARASAAYSLKIYNSTQSFSFINDSICSLQSSTQHFPPLCTQHCSCLGSNQIMHKHEVEVQRWAKGHLMFVAAILETTVHSGTLDSTSTWVHYQTETLYDCGQGSPPYAGSGRTECVLMGLQINAA